MNVNSTWEWVSACLCLSVCASLCLCLSICVFMCVCVRGLGGSGQVIHPSTSPCAWWRIWGMLNVALQPLSPHFCMLLHSITFQSSCVQPFLAWSDNIIKFTSSAQIFLLLDHQKTNVIKHDSCILMLMEICIGFVGGVAQVVRRLTDTRLMSRGQELRQRISNPTPYDSKLSQFLFVYIEIVAGVSVRVWEGERY